MANVASWNFSDSTSRGLEKNTHLRKGGRGQLNKQHAQGNDRHERYKAKTTHKDNGNKGTEGGLAQPRDTANKQHSTDT